MKQDIRFYDFDFNLVYIISDWISLNWELKYNGVGTFELQLSTLSGAIGLLDSYPYLVAIQGDKQAVITGRMITDVITVYGRTPNWLLSKRVVMPFEINRKTDYETIIRTKMGEVFDSADNITLGDALSGFEELEEYILKSPKDMETFISECLEKEHAGHRLTFQPLKHRWLFEIYRGTEKSIILSEANRNAHSPRYTGDILDVADGMYYKDRESGEYLTLPATNQGIYRWYAIGKGDNKEDALQELEGLKENSSLTFDTTDILYGKDYALGDIFPVETEFGGHRTRQLSRIRSVRIWDEHLNCGESPEFEEKEADEDNGNL